MNSNEYENRNASLHSQEMYSEFKFIQGETCEHVTANSEILPSYVNGQMFATHDRWTLNTSFWWSAIIWRISPHNDRMQHRWGTLLDSRMSERGTNACGFIKDDHSSAWRNRNEVGLVDYSTFFSLRLSHPGDAVHQWISSASSSCDDSLADGGGLSHARWIPRRIQYHSSLHDENGLCAAKLPPLPPCRTNPNISGRYLKVTVAFPTRSKTIEFIH